MDFTGDKSVTVEQLAFISARFSDQLVQSDQLVRVSGEYAVRIEYLEVATGQVLATVGMDEQGELEVIYKKIRSRCKRRKAKIFFMDEAGIRSDDPLGRSWGIKGKTPIVKTSGQRQQVNAISAVAPDGSFWYEVYSGKFNSSRMVEMLQQFMKNRGNICLILDGHPAHKSNMIKEFVNKCAGKLEIYFLPGYAPELNPDEFVWHEIKQNGTSKRPLKRNESLKDRVESDLAELKSDRIKLRNFFTSKYVDYIMY